MQKINVRDMKVGETYRMNGTYKKILTMDKSSFTYEVVPRKSGVKKVVFEATPKVYIS